MKKHNEFMKEVAEAKSLPAQTKKALGPESDEDKKMYEEDKECACGYKVEEDSEGCGKVIEEWVKEDDDGKIIDNGWYHCGENRMLCDDCQRTKRDAVYTEGEVKA